MGLRATNMTPRYQTPEMRELWSDEKKYRLWLTIEILVAQAQFPEEDFRGLACPEPPTVAKIENRTRHEFAAFLEGVRLVNPFRVVDKLHYGLGASDIIDTALAVTLSEGADFILRDLDALCGHLHSQSLKYTDLKMLGRTHGIAAEPITFGFKLVSWYAELKRNQRRLEDAKKEIAVGKISGEVGTYAHVSPEVEARVCDMVGLSPEIASTQIIPRDRHASFLCALAVLSGGLERMATEIRHLQQTGIEELEEPFEEGQIGSVGMPHKRNPIFSERICGLARVVRSNALVGLENIALWGERDISHSSAERIVLEESTSLVHYMLGLMLTVVKGWTVNTERMEANLLAHPEVSSHADMLRLIAEGISREEAWRMIQRRAV